MIGRLVPKGSAQSRIGAWIEGVPPRAEHVDDGSMDAYYEREGLTPPRKRDPSDPFYLPGV